MVAKYNSELKLLCPQTVLPHLDLGAEGESPSGKAAVFTAMLPSASGMSIFSFSEGGKSHHRNYSVTSSNLKVKLPPLPGPWWPVLKGFKRALVL